MLVGVCTHPVWYLSHTACLTCCMEQRAYRQWPLPWGRMPSGYPYQRRSSELECKLTCFRAACSAGPRVGTALCTAPGIDLGVLHTFVTRVAGTGGPRRRSPHATAPPECPACPPRAVPPWLAADTPYLTI